MGSSEGQSLIYTKQAIIAHGRSSGATAREPNLWRHLFGAASRVKIGLSWQRRKETDGMKSYDELAKDQSQRESSLLSKLVDEGGIEELTDFEAGLSGRQTEILFKITTEMEDTQEALNQVEALAQRLRRHLDKLKKLHRTLSK
jgi:hypothetical protein